LSASGSAGAYLLRAFGLCALLISPLNAVRSPRIAASWSGWARRALAERLAAIVVAREPAGPRSAAARA